MKISYEFFPPADLNFKRVASHFDEIKGFQPEFLSVTFGAGGSPEDKSLGLIKELQGHTSVDIAAHLTLVGKSIDEINAIIQKLKILNVKTIVAIRGDSPNNLFVPAKKGFINTSDFVAHLKRNGFEVCVSAYPEPHPESEGFDFDLQLLQNKVNAGATKAISQFCFDLPQYDRLVDSIAKKNINVKLIPGIMPIASIENILRMANRCGIVIPRSVIKRFNGSLERDIKVAKELCLEQLEYLQNLGLNDFHFYTLNRSDLTYSILKEKKANEVHEHKSRNAKSWQEERIKIRN